MPWYLHAYHAAWLAFFISLGLLIGWIPMLVIFSVATMYIFLTA